MTEGDLNSKKSEIAKKEEAILKFWQDNKIFEKSLEKEAPKGEFVFYDGPPFATGLPHYGHLLAGTMKDVIPRYKTMQGYYVRRRWGWDCHGLPIENLVEKELGFKTKKDIEDYGIEEFNMKARESVLRYADEWKKIIPRLGRFVDMEDDYRTMDSSYSESIWWIFKTLFDKDLIYEGYKSMHICPRCETTLSNFEVTQGYKNVTDISVTVKFKLKNPEKLGLVGDVYILAWTTTPWTLPGNVALAVGADIEYVKIKIADQAGLYILAKERLTVIKQEFEIVEEFKGQDLIGKKYQPVFAYYSNDESLKNRENGWQIYGADFVTTEDGTGVVHIAPAFGDDDYQLALKENLPFVQHVAMNGEFKPEVTDFAGLKVKPIDNPQATDIEIIKYLAGKELLFAKEKFTHSYPHCWRCNTPLLNYATSSWFVKVSEFKDKLVAENEKVNWIPEHVRDGRFGKWLEGARDWAISRTRFWGAPLPVWRCDKCAKVEVAGSVADISRLSHQSGNRYFFIRHGQAEANLKDSISADPNEPNHLTDKGKEEVLVSAEKLAGDKIDLIFSSDFVRTKETVALLAEKINFPLDKIIYDERLREINPKDAPVKTWVEYNEGFGSIKERLHGRPAGWGENYNDVRLRVMEFLFELDSKYEGKNILIASHGLPLFMVQATVKHLTDHEIATLPKRGEDFTTGELREIAFAPYPHNRHYELDLHRPYIDEFKLPCSCGGEMVRVPDVFDCWFESGSMPYAQDHYPFDKENFDPEQGKRFPADFIAEGLDQTRGWFYSLIVLGVALFGQSPYKNVITNGLVLAEDGQKMSKSLKNYPDPMMVVDNYGADALRLYLMASPAVHGEDLNFSEKGVGEIGRKIVMRLLNVLSFYQMYADSKVSQDFSFDKVSNVLDQWILIRLQEAILAVGEALDRYEIDRAVRPIDDFIEDLSTWYLRRSRDRFKVEGDDKNQVIIVTCFVLQEIAKVLAPLAPFTAEMIYQELKSDQDKESVHLTMWPSFEFKGSPSDDNKKIIDLMAETRRLVSLGLEARQSLKIKVRQPLAEAKIKSDILADKQDFQELIKEELNVKKVSLGQDIEDEVWLDKELSSDLLAEGTIRELIRQIQERRKNLGLSPDQKIELVIEADNSGREILRQYENDLKVGTNTERLDYAIVGDGEVVEANGANFKLKITQV
jgi:isoleucyl-tRNA synthetase